ncbi:N-acetylmuramoyl-L-alanine amidase [Listeria rocourtiae]|uniref:N-acetylmuramoyl-L-alanine amidase n=1 Tax=Listeria rocourtiae TaxID=647910 RepID=UPI00162A4D5A|nr:N-acetylmuramoyl-L-alanine amidase [Listeria rocourtiae]MBC1605649.1 N-acetylmuramoyl-L-alanine amidase [Listeria rocourtiae]
MQINELKLAIYAGHGGVDPGASSEYGKESEKTLELMLEATKYARSLGIKVINNRTSNVARNISADAKKANREKVDAVLEIHFDSATATAQGTTGFYCEGSATSKSLAQKVNDHVDDYFKDRGIKPDTSTRHGRLGILRETNAPAMLLETCFISNNADMTTYKEKKLLIAQAIVHGALEYFNISIPNKAPSAPTGKQGVYAKMQLNIRTKAKWDSPVAFRIPEAYYAQLNWGVRENGWVRVEYQGKVGWMSAAVPVYWNLKNPNQRYKAVKDVLTRADPKWGGKPSFRMKKGEEVNVIGLDGAWLKCSKSGVIGYLPNDGKHLVKK